LMDYTNRGLYITGRGKRLAIARPAYKATVK
jgi:hypothetical protein